MKFIPLYSHSKLTEQNQEIKKKKAITESKKIS